MFSRVLLGVLLATGACLCARAQAATFTVNSTLDAVDAHPGDGLCATVQNVCTLRAAIQETNALAGADTINVPAGTFTLSLAGADEDGAATGDLDVTDDLTLSGAGAASTIIDGGGLDRVFHIFRVGVRNALHVDIAAVTIQHGTIQGQVLDGGGIWNSGTLTLTDSVLSQNKAGAGGDSVNCSSDPDVPSDPGGPGGSGGGIWNRGTLTVTNSTLGYNTAGSGGHSQCNYSGPGGPGGDGGGIWSSGRSTVINSTLNHNNAGSGGFGRVGGFGGGGGGIANKGTLTVTSSTLSQNNAGSGGFGSADFGGDFNFGPGGDGGGIWSSGRSTVINSTLDHNIAGFGGGSGDFAANGDGGGIWSSGRSTVINSTLNYNNAAGGGGIRNYGTLTVTNSTISQNDTFPGGRVSFDGGGIANDGTATLRNTIIAFNSAKGFFGVNCSGPITDGGYNLSNAGGNTACAFSTPTSLSNTDPLLLPLQNNGGPTDTQALCTGLGTPVAACTGESPAIDAIPKGLNGCGTAITTDQRGVPRPQSTGCDIGAFEATDVLVPFAAFTAHLFLWHSPPSIAHFVAQGAFTLGKASKGIAPLTDPVVLSLADTAGSFFTQALPPGSLQPFGTGSFLFRAPKGSTGIQSFLIQATTSPRRFTFLVLGEQRRLLGAAHPPVTVSLQIGDDTGAEALPCQQVLPGLLCQ